MNTPFYINYNKTQVIAPKKDTDLLKFKTYSIEEEFRDNSYEAKSILDKLFIKPNTNTDANTKITFKNPFKDNKQNNSKILNSKTKKTSKKSSNIPEIKFEKDVKIESLNKTYNKTQIISSNTTTNTTSDKLINKPEIKPKIEENTDIITNQLKYELGDPVVKEIVNELINLSPLYKDSYTYFTKVIYPEYLGIKKLRPIVNTTFDVNKHHVFYMIQNNYMYTYNCILYLFIGIFDNLKLFGDTPMKIYEIYKFISKSNNIINSLINYCNWLSKNYDKNYMEKAKAQCFVISNMFAKIINLISPSIYYIKNLNQQNIEYIKRIINYLYNEILKIRKLFAETLLGNLY